MKRKLVIVGLVLILAVVPLAACAQPAAAPTPTPTPTPAPTETIVLEAVQGGWLGHPLMEPWKWYVETVNERAKGELEIVVLGSTDVIARDNMVNAVQEGIVDLGVVYGGWVQKIVPPAGMIHLRRISIEEMRKGGANDVLQQEFNKAGMYYLGLAGSRPIDDGHAFNFVNTLVERPQDLAGLIVATAGVYASWAEALGMTASLVSPAERYTAMERGVADGAAGAIEGALGASYFEVVDYYIDHGAFNANSMMIVNLDRWNSLPAHLQKLLTDVELELEAAGVEMMHKIQEESKQGLRDGGMKPITFSAEDAKWYVDTAYEATWQSSIEQNPEWGPLTYELWGKP